MPVAAVDVEGLLNLIWVSLLAGVGITVVFSLVVLGGGRAAAARRAHDDISAAIFAALAVLALAAFLVGVVLGVNTMLSKD
jgi:uncharacterized membrane protein YhaH (DUF805 family)